MTSSTAEALPTKDFFVSVLAKDISLVPAIIDLVDNSVDGARRLRAVSSDPSDTESFEGLTVEIDTRNNRFRLSDNCGGIPIEIAEHYAFRFGRDKTFESQEFEHPEFATGQFGVGMKRALFKLGKRFKIESFARDSRFKMDVKVADWLQDTSDDWHFDIAEVERDLEVDEKDTGTTIEVKPLHKTIAQDLKDETKLMELKTELRERHMMSLHKGLTIKLNGRALRPDPPKLIETSKLSPAFGRFTLNSGDPIHVDILCGVSDRTAREAGWSVFLNDRMVLVRDRSAMTGWGNREGERIPGYHNQYGRFRGFVFLTCSDTTRLPWDTTKTELDVDRPEYRRVVNRMISLMEPVIRFLDDVDKETTHVNEGGEPGPLLKSLDVEEADLFGALSKLPHPDQDSATHEFERPGKAKLPEIDQVPTQSIQFSRPKEEIDAMKSYFKVRSAYQAGERAWEFVLDVEDL